jgi:hypothetical protein
MCERKSRSVWRYASKRSSQPMRRKTAIRSTPSIVIRPTRRWIGEKSSEVVPFLTPFSGYCAPEMRSVIPVTASATLQQLQPRFSLQQTVTPNAHD